jgi:hypothetical protein
MYEQLRLFEEDFQECCLCGGKFSVASGDIEFSPDPFSEEINGDSTPVWECHDCRHESAMNI